MRCKTLHSAADSTRAYYSYCVATTTYTAEDPAMGSTNTPSASLDLYSAHFCLMHAKALFFEGRCSALRYKGKICLWNRINIWSEPAHWKTNQPVLPGNKLVDFFLFFRVIKQFEDGIVEAFRLCYMVCAGEYLHGSQWKTSLCAMD